MKRIKLLVIMSLILTLTTGCSVEYNITVNKDTIKEEIIVNDIVTSTRTKENILEHYNKWYPTYLNYIKTGETIPITNFNQKYKGIEYHDKSINEISNGYQYKYSYTHDILEYYNSYVLGNTFEDITIQETAQSLVLRTSAESYLCNYDYFETLKVNITFNPQNYKLNYTNANSDKNNTYTWVIKKGNCKNNQIILTLDKIKDNNKEEEPITQDYSMYIFCGILLVIVIVGYLIIRNKKRKLDDFDIDD